MITKNVNNRLLNRVHFLYMVPVYPWQPGYDDKLDECGGEPELEHTHCYSGTVVWQRTPQVSEQATDLTR